MSEEGFYQYTEGGNVVVDEETGEEVLRRQVKRKIGLFDMDGENTCSIAADS